MLACVTSLAKTTAPAAGEPKPRFGPDLKGVAGLSYFKKELTPVARQLLARQEFAVQPATYEQPFAAYPGANVMSPRFVTIDGALHLWHLFYDYSLRYIETERLYPQLEAMVKGLLEEAAQAYKAAPEGLARDAATHVLAYAAVAGQAMGLPTGELPTEAKRLADADWAKIQGHEGMSRSEVTGFDTLFDAMVPRGHYTRSETLKKYFLAMSWLGQAYWAFDPRDERAPLAAASAALMAKLVYGQGATAAVSAGWRAIYEPTKLYVGAADDPTLAEFGLVARGMYGGEPTLQQIGDPALARKLAEEAADKLRRPGIGQTTTDMALASARLMPQRFVPDTYALSKLVYDRVDKTAAGEARMLPRGLDVFAALGSKRAMGILVDEYRESRFPRYEERMEEVRAWLAERPKAEWLGNLYWGWMWTLGGVVQEKRAKGTFPRFMNTAAWRDKELWTALGSWAELRHDTILYAKQVLAEGEGPRETPAPGYVEPSLAAWRRLDTVARKAYDELKKRGLIMAAEGEMFSPDAALEQATKLIAQMHGIAEKEVAGKALTREEKLAITEFGAMLEWVQRAIVNACDKQQVQAWALIKQPTDRYMACVADVATGGEQVLEVGVGPAYAIYVIAPVGGKPTLCKGAVFSYFEFPWARGDRLTDERWLKMLSEGKAPDVPRWARSFLTSPKCPGFKVEEGPEEPWESGGEG
jgi:hypothetical protein